MKDLKLYIVTYDRPKILDDTLTNLFNTDFVDLDNTEVVIINNYSNFSLQPEFVDRVRVLHNMTRPDWSYGNLSENYNQVLIDGFRSLQEPDAAVVVHIQEDCVLVKDWVSNLFEMHKRFTFIVGKYGDNIVSYQPEAVMKIGMWDENFCGIQHKEADYWIRALICNKEKSCINDILHHRELNNKEALDLDTTEGRNFKMLGNRMRRLQDDAHHTDIKNRAVVMNDLLRHYFFLKWTNTWKEVPKAKGWLVDWSEDFIANPPKLPRNFKLFMRYPYFEHAIEDLRGKNYV